MLLMVSRLNSRFIPRKGAKTLNQTFPASRSKRMSIDARIGGGRGWRVEASGGKLNNRVDLLPRDVELLNDLVYSGSGFEVIENSGYRHTGITKYPCAAQTIRHTFHGGALGPIESCHVITLLSS